MRNIYVNLKTVIIVLSLWRLEMFLAGDGVMILKRMFYGCV